MRKMYGKPIKWSTNYAIRVVVSPTSNIVGLISKECVENACVLNDEEIA